MTRVAILGWGSLLWNPGTLHNERKWRSDGPWLPIELARTSNPDEKKGRRPYLSLVIYAHAGLVRTYWDMSLLTELGGARLDLKKRESCSIDEIACLPKGNAAWSSTTPGTEGRIQDWLISKRSDVDAVSRSSFSISFPLESQSKSAKCRQFNRFQIFPSGFPSFGRGFDSHLCLPKIPCSPWRKSFLQTNGQPCFNLVKRILRCAPVREHCSDK
jgi:hypothetical protein